MENVSTLALGKLQGFISETQFPLLSKLIINVIALQQAQAIQHERTVTAHGS